MSPLSNIDENHELYPVLKQVYDDIERVEDAIAGIRIDRRDGTVSLKVETSQGTILIPVFDEDFGELVTHDQTTLTTFTGTGEANKVIFDGYTNIGHVIGSIKLDRANGKIKVEKAGFYFVAVSGSIESSGAGARTIVIHGFANDGAKGLHNIHTERDLTGGGGDVGSISTSGIVRLERGDTFEIWVWNETNTNSILISDLTVTLQMIRLIP